MNIPPPDWAMKSARIEDYDRACSLKDRTAPQISYPERKALRAWAKARNWPTPLFFFEDAFLKTLFETQENFRLALEDSVVEIRLPIKHYAFPAKELAELDAMYEARGADGRPSEWGLLVTALREIRRAVEAGVTIEFEDGVKLTSWSSFYTWAHGRYHMLEDGFDSWIGDDTS